MYPGAAQHRAGDRFGTGPQGGLKSALPRQRRNHSPLRGLGEQAKGAIQIGLSAAVRSGDEIEPIEWDDQIAQRAITGDGQGL
jgi:hypothetical protein